jgi:tetratricopeptide (TPR) repeat protein
MARKDLVDGSNAYKDRKFPEAERLFRAAVSRDPKGESIEGQTAQLFLARTLHSQYIGDRQNKGLAESAIAEYQKSLALNQNDQSSYKAIASLYENLQKTDEWLEALTSLASKKNSCANDISDTEATKKKTTKDGKPAYAFVKPASVEDYEKMKKCIGEGMQLIDQAVALEVDKVKNAKSIDIRGLKDNELLPTQDLLKVFESARSYKMSLLIQSMRLAEMDGRTPDRDRFKTESDAAKAKFVELSEVVKGIQKEIDDRNAAKEAEAGKNVNANAVNAAK